MTVFKLMLAQQFENGAKSESGQMVSKKVNWTYFDAYIYITNNVKS